MVNSLAGRWVSGLAALALASVTAPAFATYWSLFNAEGESSASAVYVTYATLDDMLHDTNRVSFGVPDGVGFGHNIVGSGSDGNTYWSLFNAEGESSASAVYVTYATLDDMLHDTNRVSFGVPDGVGFGHNIVGSGSDGFASGDGDGNGGNIPEPSTVLLVGVALAGLSFSRRRNLH